MQEFLSQPLATAALALAALAVIVFGVAAWWAWRDNNPKTTIRRHDLEHAEGRVLAE